MMKEKVKRKVYKLFGIVLKDGGHGLVYDIVFVCLIPVASVIVVGWLLRDFRNEVWTRWSFDDKMFAVVSAVAFFVIAPLVVWVLWSCRVRGYIS